MLAKIIKNIKIKIAGFFANRMPTDFGVEPTNACNANCRFCGYQFQNRKLGVMTLDTFKMAIDQYCQIGGGDINLTPTVGDPLLDRGLVEKIKYARGKKQIKEIWLYTNLISLDDFNVEDFLKSGISSIRISTCIKDKETFKQIYRSDKYEQVILSIIKLCETNKKLGNPVNLMLFLRLPKPIDEVINSKDYKLISKYFLEKDIITLVDGYDSWGGLIKENDLPQGNKFYQNKYDQSKAPCCELYRRINILYDGKVNNCICRDLNTDLKIGDLKSQTIHEIWQGVELNKLKENWLNGSMPEVCRDCERYIPVDIYFCDRFWDIVKKYFKKLINRLGLKN